MEQEISKTGFWKSETAHIHHCRSIPLENWIVNFFQKNNYPKNKRIWDFGCGLGYYLKALHEAGFSACVGVEGQIPQKRVFHNIYSLDLTSSLKFKEAGAIICLEVLEHIPAQLTERVLLNIRSNCDDILILSWAVVGQEGFGHVNCMNNPEVISLIEKHGFYLLEKESLDARSVITDETPWFKNTLLIFKKLK